jgi:hypothetical protein
LRRQVPLVHAFALSGTISGFIDGSLNASAGARLAA